jgi:hypothetical protein
MADDYPSWTLIMPMGELPLEPPDFVAYRLADDVGVAMGHGDVISTMSRKDELHGCLRRAMRVFDTSTLDFLDRDPWGREDLPAIRAMSDGFVVSALLPEHMPAAVLAIEEMLHDADRLGKALPDKLTDAELAEHRRATCDVRRLSPDRYTDVYVVWFLQRLQSMLRQAHARQAAVVHTRFIFL